MEQINNSKKGLFRGCLETIGLILLIIVCLGTLLYGALCDDMNFVGISLIFALVMIIIHIIYRRQMKENENYDISTNDILGARYYYLETPITFKYADNIDKAIRSIADFILFIQYRTDDFFGWLQSQQLPETKVTDMQHKVQSMILSDIQTGYLAMETSLDLKSKEGFALYSVIDYFNADKYYKLEDISNIKANAVKVAQDQADEALNTFNPHHRENAFFLLDWLRKFDEDAYMQYLITLYRFFSLAAKADNIVTEKEETFLKGIMTRVHAIKADVDITKDIIYSIDTMFELTDKHPDEVVSIGDYIVSHRHCNSTDIRDLFNCSNAEFSNALSKLKDLNVIKMDGHNCEALVDEIDFVRILRGQNPTKKRHKSKKKTTSNNSEDISNAPAIQQLEKLIGLESVKKDVKTLANFVKIQKQREEKGLKASSASYHCVFTGNPGTGKTTVARIIASIYKELGVLKVGHLVETDRSGLVAEYVGQTAVKTNDIINRALDGVLFIDEAYTLTEGGHDDYGSEAIATLLKRMEDDRDRLVVIIAGYTQNMKQFIDSNPGLQSRFTRYIEFPDYSAEDLMQIFELCMSKYDYHFGEGTKNVLQQYLNNVVAHKDENFGNGRFVRNIFEKILQNQADRLASKGDVTAEQLSSIEKEDLIDL